MFAIAAGCRFAFQILNESVGEVIRSARPASCLGAFGSALRTGEFHAVFERIAIQRSPGGVTHADCLQRISAHDGSPFRSKSKQVLKSLTVRRAIRSNRCTFL